MKRYRVTFMYKDEKEARVLDDPLELTCNTFEEASEAAFYDACRFTRDWDEIPRIMTAFIAEVNDYGDIIDEKAAQWSGPTLKRAGRHVLD